MNKPNLKHRLILGSGHGYPVDDTEAHSTSYADVIKEGHGGLTLFLRVSFTALLIRAIVYLEQHRSEFSVTFSG
jgi:hypothetical protein